MRRPAAGAGEKRPHDSPPGEEKAEARRRRRPRAGAALAAAAVVAAGAVGVFAVSGGADGSGGAAASGLPPNTAEVTRQTLKDAQTVDGKLGYGPASTAVSRLQGTITDLPASGSEITRGQEVYEVDGDPIVLMYGDKPAYRALEIGTEGDDVEWFEENLRELGYDGFTVDDEYTWATAAAVREWQDDTGVRETGRVELGRVVFAPGAIRVDNLQTSAGQAVAPGAKVLDHTGTERAVTVELEPADRRLAEKGAAVEVALPEGEAVRAEIDEVTTVVDTGGQGEDPTTKIEVTVWLDSGEAAEAAAGYELASADVTFTAGVREDVLTVPVAALLALREGGFGVEVVKGGASTHVPVETGLFADGRVEISGRGVTEGTVVGMPA